MGQRGSSNQGPIACCTTRGDDEARIGETESPERSSRSKGRSTTSTRLPAEPRACCMSRHAEDSARAASFCDDGGTGGTASAKRGRDEGWTNLCDSSSRLSFSCVENRDADSDAGRRVLFGDKSLKPTLHRLRTCEAEVEALMQSEARIAKRLPKPGKPVALPAAFEASIEKANCDRISGIELVRRLRVHEESLVGVDERLITQACSRVMSALSIDGAPGGLAERPLEIKHVKAHYADILSNTDVLVQERIAQLRKEQEHLDDEVSKIEDVIISCFDKIDEERTGSITCEEFVDFVCDQDHSRDDISILISPQDAECLFNQMSNGQQEITFDQFKEEITAGCLEVMETNMEWRRKMEKRFRDTWF